jgi:hypothetical protein
MSVMDERKPSEGKDKTHHTTDHQRDFFTKDDNNKQYQQTSQ